MHLELPGEFNISELTDHKDMPICEFHFKITSSNKNSTAKITWVISTVEF